MRIAWFRSSATALPDLDIAHTVEVFDEPRACDFVWMHARAPYDLCVYELGDSAAHDFVRAYLFHYPGVLILDSGGIDRDAITASRMVVVSDLSTAEVVAWTAPAIPVHAMPIASPAGDSEPTHRGTAAPGSRDVPAGIARSASVPTDIRFGVFDPAARPLADDAAMRACAAGARVAIVTSLAEADVVVAMRWPPAGAALVDAAAGMSAARPVIVYESNATADWPALDPQTWQPRGYGDTRPPIAVSIDPRDDEHSLMLAMRRLSGDAPLRARLGAAGHAWWREHATPAHATAAWNALLDEAARLPPPARTDLPAALVPDGTQAARTLLAPFDIALDFL